MAVAQVGGGGGVTSERTCIEAVGLRCHWGGRPVLHDINLTIPYGKWWAVVGPNGAGKSTLLAALAGLHHLSAGSLCWDGRRVRDWSASARARWLAWMVQQSPGDGELTVEETVRLGRLAHQGILGTPQVDDEFAVRLAMQQTQVELLSQRRLNELSAGEFQRVLLARAFAVRAQVLLLDEPISHLDPPHQRDQIRIWQEYAREGRSVITVLHDLNAALRADYLVVMTRGRVAALGAPSDGALHQALQEVFDHAFQIQAIEVDGQMRWLAISR